MRDTVECARVRQGKQTAIMSLCHVIQSLCDANAVSQREKPAPPSPARQSQYLSHPTIPPFPVFICPVMLTDLPQIAPDGLAAMIRPTCSLNWTHWRSVIISPDIKKCYLAV